MATRAEPRGDSRADSHGIALARRLARSVKGEVRFDSGTRALYATDGSNYRQVPLGVVIPEDSDDVLETIAGCREFGAPLLSRGAGTSLAGQCCNVAVILDMSERMNGLLELNPQKRLARVQPGLICDHLIYRAHEHQLTWGPAPATHQWCTFGGMIGNNACGVHSQMAGRAADNVEELEVVTYRGARFRVGPTTNEELAQIIRAGGERGRIYAGLRDLRDRYASLIRQRLPRIPRRVSGYNLNQLLPESGFHVARALVGSESTCVTILEATVRLVRSPPHRTILVLGYPDVFTAGDHIPEVAGQGPIGLEAMDRRFLRGMKKKKLMADELALLPTDVSFLLAEFGGETREESIDSARRAMAALRRANGAPVMKLITAPEEQKAVWKVRDAGLGATAFVPGERENHEGWEDSAVPPERLGEYLRELKKLYAKYDYHGSLYGHFGQGCVHTRIDFDLKTKAGIGRFRAFLDEAAELVVRLGGSLSGEHGDGQSRAELLPKLYGPELVQAFNEFKSIWDPDWKMNPGKVVQPYRITENLRYGTDYSPAHPETHFAFPEDQHSFAHAAARCVGVGECRRMEGGTMCPSFMVTREEMHTTRGRARLLFEMLRGDPLRGGWRNETVHEALDLCLACKGCKGDCPVNVDMATYKAEFMAHYYKGRLRPRQAYAFGLIHRWARMASVAPRLANFFAQNRAFAPIAKWLAGVAPERTLPRFSDQTFKQWFNERSEKNRNQPAVILWPDTFNNHFHPNVARAAVAVLEDAGFRVEVPLVDMCCGRPLYDFGMLKTARRWLEQIIDELRPRIRAGIPVVALEPSCCAVFRDELVNLLPHEQDAKRLASQTFTLAEFLRNRAPDYPPKQLDRRALIHFHCHHRAIMDIDCEEALFRRLGIDFEILDSGCCGMAGAFGFERGERYEVSVKCGERVLLPRVRAAEPETLIVVSGFSCQEQIRQLANRQTIHLAELLHLAITEGKPRKPPQRPPRLIAREREAPVAQSDPSEGLILTAGVALAGIAGALWWKRRHKHDGHEASAHRKEAKK